MTKKILILGVNGFIGSALTSAILEKTDWIVFGMDVSNHKIADVLKNPRVRFVEGDITISKEWVEYHVKKCDVVLPLVAIATPSVYVTNPLKVFELDFEANLEVIRQCVHYKKRVIFPSTSEVYGMCDDKEFNEEMSPCVLGPIHKQRWIYSCSKQLLDRIIYAYGIHHNLDYTIFRPFNWLGPKLDTIFSTKEGSSRVVTQFISDILHKKEITLVDGGEQRRSFTDIKDGIDALLKIIENHNQVASSQIFNIGNPHNDISIKELASLILDVMSSFDLYKNIKNEVSIKTVNARTHYGQHYQDINKRVPSIKKIQDSLGWNPKVSLRESLKETLAYHLENWLEDLELDA